MGKFAKTLAIANRKGGCGKTMTAVSLAAGLAQNGKRVLCIDADSQGSLSVSLGIAEPDKLTATLARPHENGGYELLCGNRRKHACELAGLDKMPVIVRELDDDLAIIAMVDSNLQQRERILPSERAFAYKMKMDALNHNGVKADKNSCDIMAEQTGESTAQIFRFIRLTELESVHTKIASTHIAKYINPQNKSSSLS